MYNSPKLSRDSANAEMEDNPSFEKLVNDDLYNLTIRDIVECHAAVLTEIYISKLIIESPEKFDTTIVKEMEPLFRVTQMSDDYSKPLRGLLHVFQTFGVVVQHPPSSNAHQLYKSITHGEIYVLLAFLMDYSLHVVPSIFELLNYVKDGGAIQDMHPPTRFLSLLILSMNELAFNRTGNREAFIYEDEFYNRSSDILSELVNNMHSSLDNNRPETFFSLEQTTIHWLSALESTTLAEDFPGIDRVMKNALQLRLKTPDIWLNVGPLIFDLNIELPRMVITSRGLKSMQFYRDTEGVFKDTSSTLFEEFVTNTVTANYEGFQSGDSYASVNQELPLTMVPFRFLEQTLSREMHYRFSVAILYGGCFRCPLTDSIGRYVPCKNRTQSCESINAPCNLPEVDCLFKDTIETHFGEVNSFQFVTRGA